MLIEEAESLKTNTTITSGASAQIVGANTARNALNFSVDSAAASPVYILLGTGTASAANFSYCLAAGGSWDGQVGRAGLWAGAVQMFGTGAKVGIVEV